MSIWKRESLFSFRVWCQVGQPCFIGWFLYPSMWTAQIRLDGLFKQEERKVGWVEVEWSRSGSSWSAGDYDQNSLYEITFKKMSKNKSNHHQQNAAWGPPLSPPITSQTNDPTTQTLCWVLLVAQSHRQMISTRRVWGKSSQWASPSLPLLCVSDVSWFCSWMKIQKTSIIIKPMY